MYIPIDYYIFTYKITYHCILFPYHYNADVYTITVHPSGFEPGLINKELNNVVEWYSLGSNLGLSKDDLDTIRQDVGREGGMQCRLAMLTLWYNRCADVSWPELISALVLTGRRRLAHKLALKYRELKQLS